MKYVSMVVVFVLALASVALCQSGRRTASPTPTPVTHSQEGPVGYSESTPRSPRTMGSTNVPLATAVLAPAQNAKDDSDSDTLKVETNLVTIPVSVYDRNGLYIPGLNKENFKIFEDGVEQEIAYFGVQDKPFTVALLLDTSPSTQYKIEEIHHAAEAFVNQLNPQDRVIVIEFNSSVKVQCEVTNDREKIIKGIYKAKFGDGTSLYNAVDEALRKQLSKIEGRKAVVLFTDGVDTTSRKNSYDSTVNYAEESDSLIFPIYFNTFSDNQAGRGGGYPPVFGGPVIMAGTSAADYALGRKYLDDLAAVTGGRLFRPEATPGGLDRAFEGIADELRRQYNIGYVPNTEGHVGQRKTIKLRVDRPNLIIRARDSYIVGAAGTKTSAVPTPTPTLK